GDVLVLTTASNRVIVELAAADLGVDHLLATEVELLGGSYSGRLRGTPNLRDGKLERLRSWLVSQGWPPETLASATFYSDSINDLPLLSAVGRPVAVDPDAQLLAAAQARGWPVLQLQRDA
ncbi:MAG: haloacid dehalogenase-like hydrolase, partial [Rubrivivax sp.]|nr:haloacid dehalogenase-like hydrolase [Rubrivivax sp.]